jgi:UDP-2,3-diacylglucosamine hydrolase
MRIGIVAGGGAFPGEVAQSARASGHDVYVLMIKGFADPALKHYAHGIAEIVDPDRIFALLRDAKVDCLVLAGGVKRPAASTLFALAKSPAKRAIVRRLLGGGDDHLLRAVIAMFEEEGFRIVAPESVAPDILIGAGQIGAVPFSAEWDGDLQRARDVLAALSPFDVGQGCVVARGQILAIEGPEGTDAMLDRVAQMRRRFRFGRPRETGGLLVKAPKQGQERRVDLPAIGPRTFEQAARAGLSGVCVAAGGVIVVDRAATLAAALRHKLSLYGFSA